MKIYRIGVTNCITGKIEYLNEQSNKIKLMQICRASSSIPIATPMVKIDNIPYLDGGLADSIPIRHSIEKGNEKNVIILTRNKGYRKKISHEKDIIYKKYFKDYPKLVKTICMRPLYYNKTVRFIEKLEQEGKVFVIRPNMKEVSRTETNKVKLEQFYRHGYNQMRNQIEDLKNYLDTN